MDLPYPNVLKGLFTFYNSTTLLIVYRTHCNSRFLFLEINGMQLLLGNWDATCMTVLPPAVCYNPISSPVARHAGEFAQWVVM
jgi:hypothetical protein